MDKTLKIDVPLDAQFRADLKTQLLDALEQLFAQALPEAGSVFAAGCSTSEVLGSKIGTSGSTETAHIIAQTMTEFCTHHSLRFAAQCCEHLNRALVVEKETARSLGLEIVFALPVKTAGGAFAEAVYHMMKEPVLVEFIKADLGADIGDTLIGMHLKHVAVPVRTSVRKIGEANAVFARTRPKYTGGPRAVYN